MASKRPKLFHRAERRQTSARNPVHIWGTCQVGDREAEDVVVADLSAGGCKLRLVSIGVTKSERLTLLLGEEPPIYGRLLWVKQGSVGIAFGKPLDDTVLERLTAIAPPNNVVPLRRNRAG